ncbi:MAG: hypothetical protein IJI10_09525 [Eubacterium sp.]|nr:hypothetical protein [Eubacterium sp.]
MNHQEIVNSKRTMHIRPTFEEYGIVPAKKGKQENLHEDGREQTNGKGGNKAASTEEIPRTSVNKEQTKKRFLTEAEQKALDTAPNDKERAKQTALIVIRGLGTNNIDEGRRKGNLIRLKLKDPKKRKADSTDLTFGMIRFCERSKNTGREEVLLRTDTVKEAYDLFDALCRQASIITTSMWIWGLILGVLTGVSAYFLAGIGTAAVAGIAVFFFGTVILSIVHRIAPVYAAMLGIMIMIAGGGIGFAVGEFFAYWIVLGLIELCVRAGIRNSKKTAAGKL